MEKIFLTRASLPEREEYFKEIKDIWDSHWITSMGPKHQTVEKELQEFLGVKYISLFTNGHTALEAVIQALDLSGEVLTTPFTFISTTHAIVRNGLKPVFCDIKLENFTIATNKLEKLITKDTTAIIPVHTYGHICDVEEIAHIADKYNLKIIYDAAHAFGEKYQEKSVASFGDASIYSFHASKVFNSIEGGCVATNNKNLKNKLDKLRNFGLSHGIAEYIGTNGKMHEFSAAMGLCNLRMLEQVIAKRRLLTNKYNDLLASTPGIQICQPIQEIKSNYSYYPILVTSDDVSCKQLCEYLNNKKIQAVRNFYPITSRHTCYKDNFLSNETPKAIEVSEKILLLPLYETLTINEINWICSCINKVMETEE